MLSQVEAEEIVRQGVGDEVEEADLIVNRESDARVVDLRNGQIRLSQQRTLARRLPSVPERRPALQSRRRRAERRRASSRA